MTKEEIAALVAAKIEGQGTAVDAGSALPAILYGILGLIVPPTPEETFAQLSVATDLEPAAIIAASNTGLTKAQACQVLGISVGDLDAIMAGRILRFVYKGGSIPVGAQTPALVEMGGTGFAVTITYDDGEGVYSVVAE